MRILITSGGTKVPIDPVRNICNMSTGKFGSQIAKEALIAGNHVTYVTSTEGISPFSTNIDYKNDKKIETSKLEELYYFGDKYYKNYTEQRFKTFNDYSEILKSLITNYQFEIVILAAAVSDFLVKNYSDDKVRSSSKPSIDLIKAPKVIDSVKEINPNIFLAGFKLLINADYNELIEASLKTLNQSKADIIIANNLSSIENNKHEILIIEKNGSYKKVTENLGKEIIIRCMQGKKL